MSFGDILAELRKDNNMLQKDLAEYLDVSVSTVSNYETDAHFPDILTLLKIADLFDVPTDYLLCRTRLRLRLSDFNKEVKENATVGDILNGMLSLDDEDSRLLVEFLDLLKLHSKTKRDENFRKNKR